MKRLITNPTAILLFFLGFWVSNACQKDVLTAKSDETDRHIVPEYFARSVAEKFNGEVFFKATVDTPKIAGTGITEIPFSRPVKNSYTIPDKNKKPAFYIYNYADGGFVFVSAEFTLQPILAYVPNGEVKRDTVPAGLIMWMEKTVENIEIIRDGLYDNSKIGIAAWRDFIQKNQIGVPQEVEVTLRSTDPNLINSYNKKSKENNLLTPIGDEPLDPIDCNNVIITTKGPLVPVTWGQGCTYNDLINPGINYNCNLGCGNGRPWTGCVSTAMAQIVRYWKSTPIYDYASMPLIAGNSEVQKLMFHAGQFVDMDWGCSSSGAYSSKIPNALKIYFDFASGNKVNYDYLKVKNNLVNGWPVLLGGCADRTNVFLGIFYTYSNCHEWICDGYQSVDYPCWGSYLYFHMNWGWHEVGNSTDYNGWFKFDNWNISGLNLNFKYATDAIIDIHP